MPEITTAAAIAKILSNAGIEKVFGLPGSQVLDLVDEINQTEGIKFILTRHEQGAAFMAWGYAAARRGPAVCLSTVGPGATNLVTGIAAAYKANLPVLAITGKGILKVHQKDSFQEIDEVSILRPITKWSYMITHAQEAPSIVYKALRTALSGKPGPVHLSIPCDLLNQTINVDLLEPSRYRAAYQQPFARFDEQTTNMLSQALADAKRPVILAGEEVRWEGAEAALQEFAEMANIPVTTLLHFPDVMMAENPLYLGTITRNGWECANKVVQEADLVLVLGGHLDFLSTTFNPNFFAPGTKVIHVTNEPEWIGAVYPVDAGIISRITPFLVSARQMVIEKGITKELPPEVARWKAEWLAKRNQDREALINITPIKPQFVAYTTRKMAPKGAAFVGDGGNFIKYLRSVSDPDTLNSFFHAENFATVGSALPTAMGVKVADPNRPVIAMVGDAAMTMNLGELETAVREHINVVFVIFNDGGFGNVRAYQKNFYNERYTCDFIKMDFSEVARSFGAYGIRVEKPEELSPALKEAFAKYLPTVIDVLVDPMELGVPTHTRKPK